MSLVIQSRACPRRVWRAAGIEPGLDRAGPGRAGRYISMPMEYWIVVIVWDSHLFWFDNDHDNCRPMTLVVLQLVQAPTGCRLPTNRNWTAKNYNETRLYSNTYNYLKILLLKDGWNANLKIITVRPRLLVLSVVAYMQCTEAKITFHFCQITTITRRNSIRKVDVEEQNPLTFSTTMGW